MFTYSGSGDPNHFYLTQLQLFNSKHHHHVRRQPRMSRPASYFQTWENNLAAARHRYQSLYENESEDDDETYQDLPESSSSSASFVSRFSQNSAGRRLNFYPYAGPGGDEAPSDILGLLNLETSKTIAAFEVDCRTRIGMFCQYGTSTRLILPAQVCIAVVCCFLSSGVIFGFAALKPVLVREGVYSECSSDVCLLDFRYVSM